MRKCWPVLATEPCTLDSWIPTRWNPFSTNWRSRTAERPEMASPPARPTRVAALESAASSVQTFAVTHLIVRVAPAVCVPSTLPCVAWPLSASWPTPAATSLACCRRGSCFLASRRAPWPVAMHLGWPSHRRRRRWRSLLVSQASPALSPRRVSPAWRWPGPPLRRCWSGCSLVHRLRQQLGR